MMLRTLLLTTAAMTILAGPAFAQQHDWSGQGHNPGQSGQSQGGQDQSGQYHDPDSTMHDHGQGQMSPQATQQTAPVTAAQAPAQAAPVIPQNAGGMHAPAVASAPVGHNWSRGEHVPHDYRTNQYIESDWHAHNLHKPKHGYHWLHIDGHFFLIKISNGEVEETSN